MAPAHAQADEGEGAQGRIVFVTARRVAEAQDAVPISLVRLDATDLERRRVARLADLAGVVPNLAMPTVGACGGGGRAFVMGEGASVGVDLGGRGRLRKRERSNRIR